MPTRPNAIDRFWSHVDKNGPNGCWLWTGSKDSDGYGQGFMVGGRDGWSIKPHRFAYELLVAEIPPGMELDHICRVRSCVNPEHLEPVTHWENLMRGLGGEKGGEATAQKWRARTHCTRGHEFSEQNTYRHGNQRQCRRCNADHARARRQSKNRFF